MDGPSCVHITIWGSFVRSLIRLGGHLFFGLWAAASDRLGARQHVRPTLSEKGPQTHLLVLAHRCKFSLHFLGACGWKLGREMG